MPRRRSSRRSRRLATQTAQLAFAVPQVIAHRAMRMSDQRELARMGVEKMIAFNQSWNAMAMEAFLANQRLALSMMQSAWNPWAFTEAAAGILSKGMTPVRRRAVANAKRLGRTRRR
jgi:hypothetical protein